MEIIEEMCGVIGELAIQNKNIDSIKKVIFKLIRTKYKSCEYRIQKVIITDDVNWISEKYGFNDLNPEASATACKGEYGCDIVINYRKCIMNEEGNYALQYYIENVICHELQHIRDRIKYDEFINEYCISKNISELSKNIGEMFFKEYNAQFQAQSYCQIIWEYNKYSLESTIEDACIELAEIKKDIKVVKMTKDENLMKDRFNMLGQRVYDFTRAVMYKLALACGNNVADVKRERGYKCITISIIGIDNELDMLINDFLKGFNQKIKDNIQLIEYALENSLVIHNYINELFLKEIRS